jgi:hypothetical protein
MHNTPLYFFKSNGTKEGAKQCSLLKIASFELGPNSEKALQSNDLSIEFAKWRAMAADRSQWRAICGSKTPSTSKETSTSSRSDIRVKLRYGIVPS